MDTEVLFTNASITPPARGRALRETGAVVEFHGVVRETEGNAQLAGLFYEAYEPMARREFDRIISELAAHHAPQAVCVVHRLGFVPVGESSLYVRVEARHRGAALAFCGALIDRMKQDVPIWKIARQRKPGAAGSQPE
ncbi:MAG: molybdenum cofactor biosynthesis protein MoaE [Chthoniobacteraceae bacterium]